MAEVDTTPIIDDETIVPTRGAGGSMLERWIETGADAALKRVEAMVQTLERLRLASIKATYPSDWIIHTSLDADGTILAQRGYLQDSGAERASKIWGIEIGAPAIEREPREGTFEDGTYVYHMIAEAWCKLTGERIEMVEGSRWSGDPFFRKSQGPDEKVDPTDVRKAAYANLHGRAVRSLSGLNGVPVDMLKSAGLDVAKVVMVTYAKGAKGGEATGASVGTTDTVMGWGNARGTKVADLTPKDLAFYLGAYDRDVVDPAKAKFQKANQRTLDALRLEAERRTRSKDQAEGDGTGEPGVKAEPGTAPERITAGEVTKFWTLANRNGWSKEDIGRLLGQEGWPMVDQIPMKAWRVVEELLSKPPVRSA